jgi:methylmalonyl-CoA carboxyltransferase large subunit
MEDGRMIAMALALLIVGVFAVLAAAIAMLWLKADRNTALQQKSAQQVQHLASTVQALEAQIAQLMRASSPVAAGTTPVVAPPAPAQTVAPVAAKEEEITPELLVVMAAAVTVFLGKTVRIRSAKRLQSPYEIVNPWAQQGRVFVQASHNLR